MKNSRLVNRNVSKNRAAGIDISILDIDKAIGVSLSPKKFVSSDIYVSEKLDGTKLNIIRTRSKFDPDDYERNWIVSYKGTIIYSTEFENLDRETVKSDSMGVAQYCLVHDFLKNVHRSSKSIPPGTELFVEFIQSKDTLTRDYAVKHGLFLVGMAMTDAVDNGGVIGDDPTDVVTSPDKLDRVAMTLGLSRPRVLFKGRLVSKESISRGAGTGAFKSALEDQTRKIDFDDPTEVIEAFKRAVKMTSSSLGGVSEGAVVRFKDGRMLKVVQDDQYSKEVRDRIKLKYRHEKPLQDEYWMSVRCRAIQILNGMMIDLDRPLRDMLKDVSREVYSLSRNNVGVVHEKRNLLMRTEDIFYSAKNFILRHMPQNDNVLFLGRFQPLTSMHARIIEDAMKVHRHVIVGLVRGEKSSDDPLTNPFSEEVRRKMIDRVFPGISVITFPSGNVIRAVFDPRLRYVVQRVLAGTDRVESYRSQLKGNPDILVEEVPRTVPVSGTEVRTAIREGDREKFEKMTPLQIHQLFDMLRQEMDDAQRKKRR